MLDGRALATVELVSDLAAELHLDLPQDISDAVHIGLHGSQRELDVGKING